MNKIILIGRLTRDPEVKEVNTSKKETMLIAKYSLAVPRRNPDEVDFINITSFGKQAEFVEKYFHKGFRVAVEGRLQIDTVHINDEEDETVIVGQKTYATVIADSVEFADSIRDEEPKKEEPKRGRSSYRRY